MNLPPSPSDTAKIRSAAHRYTLPICVAVAAFTAIVPFFRAFFPMQLEYNEGWNVNNAAMVAHHHLLYPVRYGWTTVNYPMLSFSLVAALHRITGDYLFTARTLSLFGLIASSFLVAGIVRALHGSKRAAILAGLLCFAVFCADASMYVGIDDPQMFAQAIYLLGLLVYVRNRRSRSSLALAAFIFVLGGFAKHNLIDIPLAVLIDLICISLPNALWFSVWGLLCIAAGIALNGHFGGPYFLSQLTTERGYSLSQIADQFLTVWGPLIPLVACAIYTAIKVARNANRRIAVILLLATTLIGGYFSGGVGVSINALFSSLLAIVILVGLFFDKLEKINQYAAASSFQQLAPRYAPACIFPLLLIPMIVSGNCCPLAMIHKTIEQQREFDHAVAYLRSQSGPALCENILLCFDAQKPYIYDPFNATRLINERTLDASPLLAQLEQHSIAAVQLDQLVDRCDSCRDRFAPEVLASLRRNYAPTLQLEDAVIYTPKKQPVEYEGSLVAISNRHRPFSSGVSPATSQVSAGFP